MKVFYDSDMDSLVICMKTRDKDWAYKLIYSHALVSLRVYPSNHTSNRFTYVGRL